MTRSHFAQRARERGIASVDGEVLRNTLRRAVINSNGELIEVVFSVGKGRKIWRFQVAEGVFYAVINDETNDPITVITQAQMKRYRQIRRHIRTCGKSSRKPGFVRV